MAHICQKIMKKAKAMRCSAILFLIIFNLMMATYTIPILLRTSSDDVTSLSLDKLNERRLQKRDTNVKQLNSSNDGFLNVEEDEDYGGFPHGHLYNLQPKTGCEEADPFLLIIVCSAPHHLDLRQAIRETWSSVIRRHRLTTKLVFMLGAPPVEYSHVQEDIVKESHVHRDVIQEDFVDTYINLTIKSIGVLKWAATFCPGVKFLLKSDDDVFINVSNLISYLLDVSTDPKYTDRKLLLGHVIEDAKPIQDRKSKWFSPSSVFKQTYYPRYLSGSAYVISGDSISDLYEVATSQKPFWLEDVFITGMLPVGLGITLVHNDKFTIRKPKMGNSCFYKHIITAHEISVEDMRQIWQGLHVIDQDCVLHQNRKLSVKL